MAETENPVVTVTMASYSVSVLGEVNRPGSFQVGREKITILEALAQAGDLTIYGVRDRVKLIREDATGKKSVVVLKLNLFRSSAESLTNWLKVILPSGFSFSFHACPNRL